MHARRPARAGRLWQRLLADGGSPAQVAALSGDDRAKLLASLADVHWRDAIIAWVAPGSLPLAALPATARAGLRTWLPDLRLFDDGVAQRVTLRHLLTHTGGS